MHHGTPYSPWDFPGLTIFTPSPQLVELRGEYFQETYTPQLRPVVDHPDTVTTPDMNLLTK